jgi:hypothetical protein
MKTQTLTIEWKHLDKGGKTCERCGDTGRALRDLVKRLKSCCGPRRLIVRFREIRLTGKRIRESNAVKFNGTPIEKLLPGARAGESHCGSCSQLIGGSVSCRTVQSGGKSLEGLSLLVLWRAATMALGCDCALPRRAV